MAISIYFGPGKGTAYHLDWKTAKKSDKQYPEAQYDQINYDGLPSLFLYRKQQKEVKMKFRIKLLMAVAVILSLLSVSTMALALPVLDQAYAPVPNVSGSAFDAMAQTFTVGITGTLTQIDVMLGRNAYEPNAPTGDFVFDVRTTDGVVPYLPDTGAGILGEGTIPLNDVPPGTIQDSFFSIDLTSFGIFVNSGDVFAFVGRTFRYCFSGTLTDGYAGGSAFARSTVTGNWTNWSEIKDFAIRTYVDAEPVPEPVTMLLLGSGLLVFAGFRKRFRNG